jgi:hypothetical protein
LSGDTPPLPTIGSGGGSFCPPCCCAAQAFSGGHRFFFVAVPGMVLGFLIAVAYTIRERLTFQVFVPLDFVDDATKDDRLF